MDLALGPLHALARELGEKDMVMFLWGMLAGAGLTLSVMAYLVLTIPKKPLTREECGIHEPR